jgi:hypothetical protein
MKEVNPQEAIKRFAACNNFSCWPDNEIKRVKEKVTHLLTKSGVFRPLKKAK